MYPMMSHAYRKICTAPGPHLEQALCRCLIMLFIVSVLTVFVPLFGCSSCFFLLLVILFPIVFPICFSTCFPIVFLLFFLFVFPAVFLLRSNPKARQQQRKYLCHCREISGTGPGHVQSISGKFPGHVRSSSRKERGRIRKNERRENSENRFMMFDLLACCIPLYVFLSSFCPFNFLFV
jgi:hypothetical protein